MYQLLNRARVDFIHITPTHDKVIFIHVIRIDEIDTMTFMEFMYALKP